MALAMAFRVRTPSATKCAGKNRGQCRGLFRLECEPEHTDGRSTSPAPQQKMGRRKRIEFDCTLSLPCGSHELTNDCQKFGRKLSAFGSWNSVHRMFKVGFASPSLPLEAHVHAAQNCMCVGNRSVDLQCLCSSGFGSWEGILRSEKCPETQRHIAIS